MSGPGRPSLYRAEFCALARQHCRQGGSLDQLARLVGVSARSIDNWVVRFPEFAAAVGEGRAEVEAETDRLLYHRAVGWRETVTRTVFCAGQPRDVLLVRQQKPEAAACIRWLCRNLPQQWQRRPGRPPKPATNTPAQQCDLLAAAEVVSTLHQLSIGYEQIVERILIGRIGPEVHRTIRRHRPHVRAGKFWLLNRLPDQWSYGPTIANPAHKFPSPRPEAGQSHMTISVVSTGARSAERRDLVSTTWQLSVERRSLRSGLRPSVETTERSYAIAPRSEGPSFKNKPQNVEATSRGGATLRAAWLGTTAVNPAHKLTLDVPAAALVEGGMVGPVRFVERSPSCPG